MRHILGYTTYRPPVSIVPSNVNMLLIVTSFQSYFVERFHASPPHSPHFHLSHDPHPPTSLSYSTENANIYCKRTRVNILPSPIMFFPQILNIFGTWKNSELFFSAENSYSLLIHINLFSKWIRNSLQWIPQRVCGSSYTVGCLSHYWTKHETDKQYS